MEGDGYSILLEGRDTTTCDDVKQEPDDAIAVGAPPGGSDSNHVFMTSNGMRGGGGGGGCCNDLYNNNIDKQGYEMFVDKDEEDEDMFFGEIEIENNPDEIDQSETDEQPLVVLDNDKGNDQTGRSQP